MRILLVGDTHLDNRTPISRADDYGETTLRKLSKLLEISIKEKVDLVLISGDTFDKDKYDPPLSYINSVIEAFKGFKDNNIEVYSIIGNHDLKHNNMEYFKNSPLNILFQADVVKYLLKLETDKVDIYGIDFTFMDRINEINKTINKDKQNILVMHYATDNTIPYESISRDKLTNFDIVLSGHDHTPYEYGKNDNPIVLRPGSLVRKTKDDYNLTRLPIVYVYDTKTKEITSHEVTDKKADEVFKTEVFNPMIDNVGGDVAALFNATYFKKEVLSLQEMIKSLPVTITLDTKDKLIKYVSSLGY